MISIKYLKEIVFFNSICSSLIFWQYRVCVWAMHMSIRFLHVSHDDHKIDKCVCIYISKDTNKIHLFLQHMIPTQPLVFNCWNCRCHRIPTNKFWLIKQPKTAQLIYFSPNEKKRRKKRQQHIFIVFGWIYKMCIISIYTQNQEYQKKQKKKKNLMLNYIRYEKRYFLFFCYLTKKKRQKN